jgi:hypothetical protein
VIGGRGGESPAKIDAKQTATPTAKHAQAPPGKVEVMAVQAAQLAGSQAGEQQRLDHRTPGRAVAVG